MSTTPSLSSIIEKGSVLCSSKPSEPSSNLKDVLVSRLYLYYTTIGQTPKSLDSSSLEDVQLETAQCALNQIMQVSLAIESTRVSIPSGSSTTENMAVGTRDLATIRTLFAITFKWAVDPPLQRLIASWPTKNTPRLKKEVQIIDLTSAPEDHKSLSSTLRKLLTVLFPNGTNGDIANDFVAIALMERHLADILRPCIILGWLPKSLSTDTVPVVDELRPPIMRLLSRMPAFQTITALGTVLRPPPSLPLHAHKACTSLLSRQLLRPEGVRGLCVAVFGDEDHLGENAPLEKLEHVSQLLKAVPAGMEPKEYFGSLVSRIIEILQSSKPINHVRASAYTLSQMLSTNEFRHRSLVLDITALRLHIPFSFETSITETSDGNQLSSAQDSLAALIALLINTDPSPALISSLLTPIFPSLYSLSIHLKSKKTTDPAIRKSLEGLLATWGRLVDTSDGLTALWQVIEDAGGEWDSNITGEFWRVKRHVTDRSSKAAPLSLFTPEDLQRAEEDGELDLDANIMDLRPDPASFVQYLKSIERSDISSELFVRLLNGYRELRFDSDSDPLKTLLFLQLIVQMQNKLSDDSSSNILNNTDHILSFVKHALESTPSREQAAVSEAKAHSYSGKTLETLRIIEESKDEIGADSDDEEEEDWAGTEMTTTAVNLLLAILEKQTELSPRTTPILNEIFDLLGPLSSQEPETLRAVAREARMVITARLASGPASQGGGSRKSSEKDDIQETYQKALKLLQDPILPVRAHGLLLLRQLVTPAHTKTSTGAPIDRAFIPAILNIFLQSLHDDDSYIFLNAVQGLSTMVDGFGREVLGGLVKEYADKLDGIAGTQMSQAQLDVRLRVGEALGQVIRRSGSALGLHAELLIPTFSYVFRAAHVPTPMRMSALSLLAQCANTYILVILPYTNELADAMVDLLQLESASAVAAATSGEEIGDKILDSQPTVSNAKVASLRRSALHFLSLMLRAFVERAYDSADIRGVLVPVTIKRLSVTLKYVAVTDPDGVVRVQARETIELLDQME